MQLADRIPTPTRPPYKAKKSGVAASGFPYIPALMSYFFLLALVATRMITFESWQQVEYLHNSGVDLDLLYGHPHFFRYLIVRPGLQLADRFGDVGFSVYLAQLVAGSLLMMFALLRGTKLHIASAACSIIFVAFLFMNGRGAVAWFGWMIILTTMFAQAKVPLLIRAPAIILALLCTSVSSGTFSVAFGTVIGHIIFSFNKKTALVGTIFLGLIFFVYWGLFLEGINRNLSYYSLGTRNPLFNMLRHGLGDVVLSYPFFVTLGFAAAFLAGLLLWIALREKPEKRELVAILVPLAGGVFGYTTLSLLLPAFLVVVGRRLRGDRYVEGTAAQK